MVSETIEEVIAVEKALKVYFGKGNSIKFEDCWLRDQCRCSICYRTFNNTFQRAQHLLYIPDATIAGYKNDKTKIEVTWSDEHKSTYTAEFLSKFDYKTWKETRDLRPKLWHGSIENKVAKVPVKDFLKTVEGVKRVFQSVLDYGVALIEGVDVSLEATEVISKKLGGVWHTTMFGGMWQLASREDHADSAYNNLHLAAHNDNTYFTEATGLLVIHCLEYNGTGGETILVDGFYGATELKKESPEDFKFLSTFNVTTEYAEDGHHYAYSAPIIKVDTATQELLQIRFNVYDRSPMAFSSSVECRTYYRSLRSLGKYYENLDNQWRYKLRPGTVMIIDNFRLLHGRTSYTGSRVLGGAYVMRSDWQDQARLLGLIQ